MADSQFISELFLVILEGQVLGFDQADLDDFYGKYDEPSDSVPDFIEEEFSRTLARTKTYILQMYEANAAVPGYLRGVGNFYTLWALVALAGESLPAASMLAGAYATFMQRVELLAQQQDLGTFLREWAVGEFTLPLAYLTNSSGASTDLGPRKERLETLRKALLGEYQ